MGKNIKKLGYNYNVLDYNQALIAKSQEFFNTLNNPDFSYWGEDNHEPQVGKIQPRKNTVVTYDEFEKSIGSEKKDFLFLCRHWKIHRLVILYKLYQYYQKHKFINEIIEEWGKITNGGFIKQDKNGIFKDDYYLSINNKQDSI